jgi:pimeloyl-ACP methyl ester carboxylesterase
MSPLPSPLPTDPTTLDKTFHHTSPTHSFTLSWTSLGSPTSPPLIFIHGTPWSSLVWAPYALALSRTHHVYLFDNPGFGDSPLEALLSGAKWQPRDEVERLDSDLGRQSEAFAALFKMWEETEGWEGRPHVVAHDHGGLMALSANLLYGCEFASLCLIDVVVIGPFGQPLFKSIAENPKVSVGLLDMAFEGLLES